MTGNVAIDFDSLHAALEKSCDSTRRVSRSRWELGLLNSRKYRGEACLDTDWIQIKFPKPGQPGAAEEILRGNAHLTGVAKRCIDDAKSHEVVRAELPVTESFRARERIGAAINGFRQALHGDRGTKQESGQKSESCELASLLEEAGWKFAECSGGYSVRLNTGDSYHSASLFPVRDGVCIRSVLYKDWSARSELTRSAVSLLLLRASTIVRMARASIREEEPGFEIVFETSPDFAELGHALAALSTSCRIVGREVAALIQDEQLAKVYLACQGW